MYRGLPPASFRARRTPTPARAWPRSAIWSSSLEHVAAQAKEYGHSNRRELAYLVTHSVLHLLGYDHLDEGPMKAQMREHEEAIMKRLDLER